MSNLRLLTLISVAPLLFIFVAFFLAQSVSWGIGMFWDSISLLIVVFFTWSFYFASANNKTYINSRSKDLKFNYLKEMFLFSAFMGTSLGISFMWFGFYGEANSDSGTSWAMLGSSMAVAITTDSYGFLGYFGTFLVQYFLEKKSEIQDRVTNRIQANKFISLVLLILPFIILYFVIYPFLFDITDSDFTSYVGLFGNFILAYFFIIFCSAIFLVGSNFNIVLKSFWNSTLEVNEVVETISYLKRLCRLIFISLVVNTLFSTVAAGAIFGSAPGTAIGINYMFSYLILIFSLSTFIIIYLRTFIFRLNLDLVEINHMHIDSDKYFIFKYTVPIYLLIHLISAFGFLIMIFN